MAEQEKKQKAETSPENQQQEGKDFRIEEALQRIEEINQLLGSSSTSLAESLQLYREGVELAEACRKNLDGVEKQIQELTPDGDEKQEA